MEDNITIGELTNKVESASTNFEKNNTELKRKYLIWNIEAFNSIASAVSVSKRIFLNRLSILCFRQKLRRTATNYSRTNKI